MVLDTIKDGNFIFKNTDKDNKQVTIPMKQGPLEFYYLHIKLTEEAENELKMRKSKNEPEHDFFF